ncbi:endonuclease MutS2 [Fodinibius halophilus]|uniref:Endonuclease MutS2 n=1 Tax=Fodinibius halophilus TaxID=1736908 RepID=A0A6M1T7P9_9BACT|nr:endonuclease MutS2 [Fodinibius halophilus]NGP89435.1 endonuclease MutS2 [Fodinibius halophilus]
MHLFPEHLSEKIGFNSVRSATQDKARSEMAKTKLATMQPFSDRQVIERRLEQTAEMMDLLLNDSAFPLNNLHDVQQFLDKARPQNSIIPLQAFVKILELSITARRIKTYIEQREEHYPALKEVSIQLIPLKELEETLQGILTENGELRDDASPKLRSIRKRINRRKNDLRTTINRVMGRLSKKGMASDEGPTIRNGRMVVPVQVEYKRKVKGFVHDVSSSGQTVYLEPVEALNINNEIRQLESEEKQEIERILRELTGEIRSRSDKIRQNMNCLTTFDIIRAKAELSIDLDGFTPVISESSHLYIKEAYNPLLLLKNRGLPESKQEKVVPLDMELEEEERCLVITGPNAGGKSVALKTLGLCSMMIQAGFAIPARDSSEIPIFSSIFVDMGDDQSIENDLSTFSSRLEWMKHTLENADKHSLVLIDEAAAGTDPEEGGALFQAFIEILMERNAKILVTTHHGSLKVFAHDHEYAVNGSMKFDQDTLSPTYRFKKGVPGSSYAFEIAERMQLQEQLLNNARTLLGEAKGDMETLITELETKSQEAEELKKKYDKLKAHTEKERNRYKEKRSAIEKEKEKIREKALNEAKQIMDSANKKIEEAVERIVTKGEKDDETIQKAREEVEEHRQQVQTELQELEEEQEERYQDAKEQPEVGDLVRLKDANTTGELKKINGNKAVISAGGLRVKTKYKKLIKVEDASKQKKEQKVKVNFEEGSRYKMVKPQLSIRGMRGREAMKEVEHYIDNALAAGRNEVHIVHGKGEGILKNLVHEYLNKRKEVSSYEIAPIQKGGAGCTVVHF